MRGRRRSFASAGVLAVVLLRNADMSLATAPTASVSTTPLRPLELPPFALYPLIERIFPPASALPATSPAKATPSSPPSSSLTRLGQLVGASATGAGAEGTQQASVRSVEASGDKVWVGGSDGRVRFYEVDHDAGTRLGRSMSPTSHMLTAAGRRTPTGSPTHEPVRPLTPPSCCCVAVRGLCLPIVEQDSVLELTEEGIVTQTRKAADRIALMERLNKAVILSGLSDPHLSATRTDWDAPQRAS